MRCRGGGGAYHRTRSRVRPALSILFFGDLAAYRTLGIVRAVAKAVCRRAGAGPSAAGGERPYRRPGRCVVRRRGAGAGGVEELGAAFGEVDPLP